MSMRPVSLLASAALAATLFLLPATLSIHALAQESTQVHNTAPLGALRTTIEHATIIIGGLQRGRARLGG